jgi:hypothetical protein
MAAVYVWLSGKREEKLAMAFNWLQVLGRKAAAWGVPDDVVNGPEGLAEAAREAAAALAVVLSAARTSVAVARCKAQMKTLAATMRRVKRRYFTQPPLSDEDVVSLGLKPRKAGKTPAPTPADHVAFLLSHIYSDHIVVAAFSISGGMTRGKGSYHGVEVRYWVLPLDARPPATADAPGWRSETWTASPWSHTFDAEDIGRRLYVAMRWVNRSNSKTADGGKGPWSAIRSIIIS